MGPPAHYRDVTTLLTDIVSPQFLWPPPLKASTWSVDELDQRGPSRQTMGLMRSNGELAVGLYSPDSPSAAVLWLPIPGLSDLLREKVCRPGHLGLRPQTLPLKQIRELHR